MLNLFNHLQLKSVFTIPNPRDAASSL